MNRNTLIATPWAHLTTWDIVNLRCLFVSCLHPESRVKIIGLLSAMDLLCRRCPLKVWPQLWCEHCPQGVCEGCVRVCSACGLDFCSDRCLMFHLCEPNQYQLAAKSAAILSTAPKSAPSWSRMPKYPNVKIGGMIKMRVALDVKHESNMMVPVWKIVEVRQQEGLAVDVDRSCLFACDSMTVHDGPRRVLQTFQVANLVCPCCNRSQHDWLRS